MIASEPAVELDCSKKFSILHSKEVLFGVPEKFGFCLLCGEEIREDQNLLCSLHAAQVIIGMHPVFISSETFLAFALLIDCHLLMSPEGIWRNSRVLICRN
jgi:hypothetical protein